MSAGQHLVHMAAAAGEQVECERGWLGRRKRWRLPPELRTIAEVCMQRSSCQSNARPAGGLSTAAGCADPARSWSPRAPPRKHISQAVRAVPEPSLQELQHRPTSWCMRLPRACLSCGKQAPGRAGTAPAAALAPRQMARMGARA